MNKIEALWGKLYRNKLFCSTVAERVITENPDLEVKANSLDEFAVKYIQEGKLDTNNPVWLDGYVAQRPLMTDYKDLWEYDNIIPSNVRAALKESFEKCEYDEDEVVCEVVDIELACKEFARHHAIKFNVTVSDEQVIANEREFLDKMQVGDVLKYYNTSPAFWKHLCGKQGYEIKRNRGIVATRQIACN